MSWLAALRTRVRLAFARRKTETRMDREFAFHVEMETEKNIRNGMPPDEARRQAMIAFGGSQEHREQMRDGRGVAWLNGLSLDLKLGLRMLAKAPGLAIIGGLGMALATAVAAGSFAIFNSYFWPTLPLDEGDRVVSIINWDPRLRDADKRVGSEFDHWRREVESIVDIGAFRSAGRNLISPSGESEPIVAAEMSAAGFRLARVAPLLGRSLLDTDEMAGAPPVLVIGYDVWQARYHGDHDVLGRTVRLGHTVHVIVGVMPPDFAFPISHSYWIPLRLAAPLSPGQGPELTVFGRLAPGTTREEALAELVVVGRRFAQTGPPDRALLQPRIVPYTDIFAEAEGDGWEVAMMQLTISLLLVLICINVAALVYARTIGRTSEIAVRTALGASRRRIVIQLFLEAFVLSLVSAAVGLGLVGVALSYFDRIIAIVSETGRAPFWIQPGISVGTVVYTLGLAALGAVIVGVLPGLRATGRRMWAAMAVGGAGTRAQLGPTWTFLIVAQVAVAVAVLPLALSKGNELVDATANDPGFPTEEFLWARFAPEALAWEGDGQAIQAMDDDLAATQHELLTRIRDETAVRGATLAIALPGNEPDRRVEVDIAGPGVEVRSGEVDEHYFALFEIELVGGRTFGPGDAAVPASDRPVIVNRSFEAALLGGASASGHRMRYRMPGDSVAEWLTIVGVVEDFPTHIGRVGSANAAVYHLTVPGEMRSGLVITRFRGEAPAAFTPTLRQIAASVDPTLQLYRIRQLSTTYTELGRVMGLLAVAVGLVTASVLLLSAGGIHALMSFTINQRRREIGIRSALGADARRILSGVLAQAIRQLGLGVVVGLALALLLDRWSGGEAMGTNRWILLPVIVGIMIAVGLAAAAGPARRGLRVQPTEALRSD